MVTRLEDDFDYIVAGAGTAVYCSPQQLMSVHASPQDDIYSYGVLLFSLLTARKPPMAVAR